MICMFASGSNSTLLYNLLLFAYDVLCIPVKYPCTSYGQITVYGSNQKLTSYSHRAANVLFLNGTEA